MSWPLTRTSPCVAQEAHFLEVCSFSRAAFFALLCSGPVEAGLSYNHLPRGLVQSISTALSGDSLEHGPSLNFKTLPQAPHQDCVDKNMLNSSKQPSVCFCTL